MVKLVSTHSRFHDELSPMCTISPDGWDYTFKHLLYTLRIIHFAKKNIYNHTSYINIVSFKSMY